MEFGKCDEQFDDFVSLNFTCEETDIIKKALVNKISCDIDEGLMNQSLVVFTDEFFDLTNDLNQILPITLELNQAATIIESVDCYIKNVHPALFRPVNNLLSEMTDMYNSCISHPGSSIISRETIDFMIQQTVIPDTINDLFDN